MSNELLYNAEQSIYCNEVGMTVKGIIIFQSYTLSH